MHVTLPAPACFHARVEEPASSNRRRAEYVGGTVGKHEAPESSSPPLVEAALAHHSGEGGAHRTDRLEGQDGSAAGPVGWPGPDPAPGGGRLGWPAF
jgi:hypothetical protein